MLRKVTEAKTSRRTQMVGLGRIELPTSRLSGVRSSHLSYRPSRLQQPARRNDYPTLAILPLNLNVAEVNTGSDGCRCTEAVALEP